MPPGNQIEFPDGRLQFEKKRCREPSLGGRKGEETKVSEKKICQEPLLGNFIIAQAIEAQRDKKSFVAVMQVSYAGSRGQSSHSSTTFRTTRLPPPGTLGLGSFRLGSAATVRPGAGPAGWP